MAKKKAKLIGKSTSSSKPAKPIKPAKSIKSTPIKKSRTNKKSQAKPQVKPTARPTQKTAVKTNKSKQSKSNIKKNQNQKKSLSDLKAHSSSKLDAINEKLDKLLSEYDTILKEEKKIESKEDRFEHEQKKIEALEEKELAEEFKLEQIEKNEDIRLHHIEDAEKNELFELQKLEALEEKIKKDVEPHPLAKISAKDFFKGSIGAFVGLVVHFSFNYVFEIAEHITFTKATFLYILSFAIGAGIMYATGFRKVTEPRLLIFWPLRATIIYLTALLMSIIVLFIFGKDFGIHFAESYIQTSVAMISAIIGATTADLIGRE